VGVEADLVVLGLGSGLVLVLVMLEVEEVDLDLGVQLCLQHYFHGVRRMARQLR
jgi:hypothetical protein